MVCLMRRPPFRMLYLIMLMNFRSAVLDSSNAVHSFLRFRLVFIVFLALLF